MTLTTHALVGAVIGKYFQSPLIIIPASIIAHYSIDTLRHGEYLNRKSTWKNTTWKVLLDLSIGLASSAFLVYQIGQAERVSSFALAIFFSILPDFLTLLYWKLGVKQLKFLFDFHVKIHAHPQQSPERQWTLRNSINDILLCVASIILLLF